MTIQKEKGVIKIVKIAQNQQRQMPMSYKELYCKCKIQKINWTSKQAKKKISKIIVIIWIFLITATWLVLNFLVYL